MKYDTVTKSKFFQVGPRGARAKWPLAGSRLVRSLALAVGPLGALLACGTTWLWVGASMGPVTKVVGGVVLVEHMGGPDDAVAFA